MLWFVSLLKGKVRLGIIPNIKSVIIQAPRIYQDGKELPLYFVYQAGGEMTTFPKKPFSSILEMTKISHLNWFQCIKGDPNNGRDELEPNRSYLNHISTWYAKLSNFYMYFCWKLFTLLSLGETAQGTFTNKKTRTKMSTWNCGSPRMCPGLIKFKKQEEKLKWQNIFMNMTMLVWKAEECVSAWFNKCHRFRVQTKIQISHRLFYFYLATTKILRTLYPINAWFRNIF